MTMRNNKILNIIIIGATSGIGRALTEDFAEQGNNIGIIGRREILLKEIQQQSSSTIIPAIADVTKQKEIEHAIKELAGKLGHIDLAIVCAGTGNINTSLDYAIESPTLLTNVTGWTFCIDILYKILERQGYGHLVAITSAGGLRGEPMAPAYSASKAYQINYMEALSKKAFKAGGKIIVTDIRPGLVDTAMAKGDGLFWVMPVKKVASQIIRAIRKKKNIAYVTKRWRILAAINKRLPFCIYKRL